MKKLDRLVLPEGVEPPDSIYDGPACGHCGLVLAGAGPDVFYEHHDRAHPQCAKDSEPEPERGREPRSLAELISQVTDSVGGPLGYAEEDRRVH